MEVHHHPQVEKKNFKEYFLEFLMIFLAVTMGFFAESIRESISDNAKEKEYILSMLEDVKKDTANIHEAINLNTQRALALDTLANLCINYSSKNEDASIYRLYRTGLVHPSFINVTERTLSQLKNSGAMRLIRKKTVIDSIVLYDDLSKKLTDQQAYYERYQNESINSAYMLMNFSFFNAGGGFYTKHQYDSAKLLSADKMKLIEFGNRIWVYKGVVSFYIVRLQETKDHAMQLINTIKQEYHLENE